MNNTNYRYLMPSMDPCDGNGGLRELISKPQNCSVSWAFAITNSIEYAIKKMYFEEYDQIVEVSLSAQELIDCVGKEHGVVGKMCDGMPLVWGFDYVYENGIAYSEYYPHTNVEGECKRVEDEHKYHIGGYENGGTSRSVDTPRSASYPVLSQLLVSHYTTAPSIVEGSQ